MCETRACPACKYVNPAQALLCGMCSQVLQRKQAIDLPQVEPQLAQRAGGFDLFAPPDDTDRLPLDLDNSAEPPVQAADSVMDTLAAGLGAAALAGVTSSSWQNPIFKAKSWKYHYAVGLVLGLIFVLPLPIVKQIGWFFSSLVHEMGHTGISYYLGSIALPALRLDGHAATMTMDQSWWLAWGVWLALAIGTVYFKLAQRTPIFYTLLILTLTYPLLAFTDFKEVMFLVGGHGGEVVMATIFFWRAAVISHKVREQERTLYAALAWYLWFQNLVLHWNLMFSAASREWYLDNGSFGMENDFVRLADLWSWSLPQLSFWMLLLTFAVPPLGLAWAYWSMGGHMRPQASVWGD